MFTFQFLNDKIHNYVKKTKYFAFKFIFILTSIVITKFMFICIWKNMRSINDTLVTRIVIRCCFVIAMVFCLIRAIVQEKQSFLMVSGKTVAENWDSKLPSVETIFSPLQIGDLHRHLQSSKC